MKRIGAAILSVFALVVGAVVVPTSPAQAGMFNGTTDWTLEVNPNISGGIVFRVNTPSYYKDDDTYDESSVSLTGPASFKDPYGDWNWTEAPFASMPSGVYTYAVTYRQAAHWHCSQYNPDGCSWYSEQSLTARFKFRWNGSTLTGVKPMRATKTIVSARASKKNKKSYRFVVKGRAKVQARSTSNFQPTSKYVSAKGRKVRLLRYDPISMEYRTVKTVKTRANGTYTIHAKGSKKKRVWKVEVVGGATYAESFSEYREGFSKAFKR